MREDPEKFKQLDKVQRNVLATHKRAADAWVTFQKTGQKRIVGILRPPGSASQSHEDSLALGCAMVALCAAMKYYSQHGKIKEAYNDLRDIAKQHWHPAIHERWDHHFTNRAREAKVELPECLNSDKLAALSMLQELKAGEEIEDMAKLPEAEQQAFHSSSFDPAEIITHQIASKEKKGKSKKRPAPFKQLPPTKN